MLTRPSGSRLWILTRQTIRPWSFHTSAQSLSRSPRAFASPGGISSTGPPRCSRSICTLSLKVEWMACRLCGVLNRSGKASASTGAL